MIYTAKSLYSSPYKDRCRFTIRETLLSIKMAKPATYHNPHFNVGDQEHPNSESAAIGMPGISNKHALRVPG